jgi:hypothetical protein
MKKIIQVLFFLPISLFVACGPSDDKKQEMADSVTEQSIKSSEEDLINAMSNMDSLQGKTDSVKKEK